MLGIDSSSVCHLLLKQILIVSLMIDTGFHLLQSAGLLSAHQRACLPIHLFCHVQILLGLHQIWASFVILFIFDWRELFLVIAVVLEIDGLGQRWQLVDWCPRLVVPILFPLRVYTESSLEISASNPLLRLIEDFIHRVIIFSSHRTIHMATLYI